MIGETWRFPRGCGLFHYNKMEKKHATIHTETAQLNKKANCQRSDQAARTLWMKWKKLWMSGQSLSMSQIGLYVWWVAIRKPLLRKANMKSLSLPEDIWLYILALFSREKSSMFGVIEIKLNLFKQNHVQEFLVSGIARTFNWIQLKYVVGLKFGYYQWA